VNDLFSKADLPAIAFYSAHQDGWGLNTCLKLKYLVVIK